MNMEKVIRFKTMIGYCYLYPDRIIMARNGNPEEVNLKNEEQRLWKHLVFYTITGLLLAWLAYMDRDHLPMCLWLGLTSAWLLFNVLRSIFQKSSSSALNRAGQDSFCPVQERSKIPDTFPIHRCLRRQERMQQNQVYPFTRFSQRWSESNRRGINSHAGRWLLSVFEPRRISYGQIRER